MTEQPKNISPPKWADKLLKVFLPEDLVEELQGDMHEQFEVQVEEVGLTKAKLLYVWEVLRFCRPYYLKRRFMQKTDDYYPNSIFSISMIRNYFKIAWRNFVKHKAYSAINVIGLAFGLTCFFMIALYLFDELTFDTFHQKADRIYRLTEKRNTSEGKQKHLASVAYKITDYAKNDMPEVEDVARFSIWGRNEISIKKSEKVFNKEAIYANQSFFNVFSYSFIAGNPSTALKEAFTTVITEDMAMQMFGTTDVLNEVIHADGFDTPFRITGVCANIPLNSSFRFDVIYSELTMQQVKWFPKFTEGDWGSNQFISYVLLKEKAEPQAIAAKIGQEAKEHVKAERKTSEFYLQPLKDIHFYSKDLDTDAERNISSKRLGDINYVYIFALIGCFVLLIACINYVNLTTAQAARRSKEIGIRKAAGAQRISLTFQILMESLLVTTLALVLAIGVVQIILPFFNAFTEKSLALNFNSDYRIWLVVVIATAFTGLLSGYYPAMLLSKYQPLMLIKGRTAQGNSGLRRGLVVFQFTLSVVMIVATIIAYLQLDYIGTKNLGFTNDQMVVIDINRGDIRKNYKSIMADYHKIPEVNKVTMSSRVPGEWKVMIELNVRLPQAMSETKSQMTFIGADENFLDTYNIRLASGRNFTTEADSSAVLINETAAKELGIKTAAGQWIEIPKGKSESTMPLENTFRARVVGIVRDFHFRSLHETIGPVLIGYHINPIQTMEYYSVQISRNNVQQTLGKLDEVLSAIDPKNVFEYHFLDEQMALFYIEDAKRNKIFIIMALVAIFIACLGLFGLATFTAEQRVKEIGVRKVLGASVWQIISLLSGDFLKLVMIAVIIASPIAWYAMHQWLKSFAYHINVEWWVFIFAGFIASCIALLTVSFQAIKAALVNPVKSLKNE